MVIIPTTIKKDSKLTTETKSQDLPTTKDPITTDECTVKELNITMDSDKPATTEDTFVSLPATVSFETTRIKPVTTELDTSQDSRPSGTTSIEASEPSKEPDLTVTVDSGSPMRISKTSLVLITESPVAEESEGNKSTTIASSDAMLPSTKAEAMTSLITDPGMTPMTLANDHLPTTDNFLISDSSVERLGKTSEIFQSSGLMTSEAALRHSSESSNPHMVYSSWPGSSLSPRNAHHFNQSGWRCMCCPRGSAILKDCVNLDLPKALKCACHNPASTITRFTSGTVSYKAYEQIQQSIEYATHLSGDSTSGGSTPLSTVSPFLKEHNDLTAYKQDVDVRHVSQIRGLEILAPFRLDLKKKVGFQLEDIILDCRYAGRNCHRRSGMQT